MMLQLLTDKGELLYELEQSAQFPDYRSVLVEAIATGINLNGLKVQGENLANITWRNITLESVFFYNCTMVNNRFENCFLDGVYFTNCNLQRLKVKRTSVHFVEISSCDATGSSFRELKGCNGFNFMKVDISKSVFYQCEMSHASFWQSTLNKVLFDGCTFNSFSFIHSKDEKEWLKDAKFFNCIIGDEVSMRYHSNVSVLDLYKTNIRDVEFKETLYFTEIINEYTHVLFEKTNNTVWIAQFHSPERYRGTLEQLETDLLDPEPEDEFWNQMYQVLIESELFLVLKYLKTIKNNDYS